MAKVKTIADVTPENAALAQQAALMRVQLYGIMETHRLMADLDKRVSSVLLESASPDGQLGGLGLNLAQEGITRAWNDVYGEWMQTFESLRWIAAAIPFGTVTVLHRHYFGELKTVNESVATFEEQDGGGIVGVGMVGGGWFTQQLQVIIDAANAHVYEDGLNLSQRIWRMDRQGLAGIMQIVYGGVANGNSAWNLAKQVEGYLGAGKDCPRWARSRLFGLTKQQIADGDRTGLVTGDACAGQGVSYNALRLMRNELQIVHGAATDTVLGRMPWVEKEEVRLSPSHPDIGCECEDVVVGGEGGKGIYPKGTIKLPIHIQCLCMKLAVLMDDDEFVERARGWMTGTAPWAAMDEYAGWLGLGKDEIASGIVTSAMMTAAEARQELEQVSSAMVSEIAALEVQQADLLSQYKQAQRGDNWELTQTSRQQFIQACKQLDALRATLREQTMDLLAVQNPAQFLTDMSRVKADRRARWDEGVDAFRRLVGLDTLDGETIKLRSGGRGRSHYSSGQVNLTTSAGVRSVVHELGHWLEETDPSVLEKALAFYDRRTSGESEAWLGDSYNRSEKARRDQFISAYMGKEYSSKGTRYATEIVSMGLEMMYADPVKFAREDADYFDFIFNLVRGL